MLYGKHLGLRGVGRDASPRRATPKLRASSSGSIEELKALGRAGAMHARAVWRFFPARGRGGAA